MPGTGNRSFARVCTLTLLIALAFAGNYFKLSLFFGFDFLFGSIFLMIILNLFGVGWGVFAALVATSCTYIYWHHPYGIVTFSLEILIVGLLWRSKFKNLVLLDAVYWICIGSPLNWLLFNYVMEAEYHSTLLVILKQSVNGIFNALLAGIILDYLLLHNWLGISATRKKIPIQQALFHLILVMILLPVFAIMIINSRKSFAEIENTITHKLENTSIEATQTITAFIQRHMEGVKALAALTAGVEAVPGPLLQKQVKLVKGLYPDFYTMYVANSSGVTVAFDPEKNDKGEPTIGMDFSDRPYYQELKKTLRPVVSNVFMGRGGIFAPIVTFGVPILKEGQFKGFALGAVNLNLFGRELETLTDAWGVKVMILDEQNKVITSTNEAFAPLQEMDWRQKGEVQPLRSNIFKWFPPKETTKSAFDRWKKSSYFLETHAGENIPWHVLLSVPVAPYQKQLYETTYIYTFLFMLIIILVSTLISAFLSRKLVYPIEKLKNATTDLPDKVARQTNINWPDSNFSEIHSLVGNFKGMSTSLMQKFLELQTAKESLEQRVTERTRELLEMQDELVRKEKLAILGQLSGSVGHELRNPLGVISNAVYFLQTVMPDADETVREYLGIIKSEVNTSQRIITDLLDFTRMKTAQTKVMTVDELIKQGLGRCAVPTNVLLRVEIPDTLPVVKVDPLQMGQVFQNLATNAIQAMPKGGELRISARKGVGGQEPEGGLVGAGLVPAHGREGQPQGLPLQKYNNFIEISVTDTGEGIAPENMSRLFQPLFTTKARGIGLGLKVSKNLVEANGGRIEVESELGKGATFTVILPVGT